MGGGEGGSRFHLIDLWVRGIIHGVNIPPPTPQGKFSLRRGKPRIESWENF